MRTLKDRPDNSWTLNERIDVCRGVFAIMVVIDHALQVTWGIHRDAESALNPVVCNVLNTLLGSSTAYVMGFFILSGFCIENSVAKLVVDGRFDWKRYSLARLTRILPLYYAALFFTVLVEWLIAYARPLTWPNGIEPWVFEAQLALLQNLTQTYGSFVASWSITNESFYYLVYGTLVTLFAKQPKRSATLGLVACLLTAVVTQALYVTNGRHPFVYGLGMLFGLGMIWFVGVLIAQRSESWLANRWVRGSARGWWGVFAIALAWKALHLPPQGNYLIPGAAFALMMLRFQSLEQNRRGSIAVVPSVRKWFADELGWLSYPLYLFHGPLMMLVGSWLIRQGLAVDWRITWLLLVMAGLLAGAILSRWVERPLMVWRSAWLKGGGQRRSIEPRLARLSTGSTLSTNVKAS